MRETVPLAADEVWVEILGRDCRVLRRTDDKTLAESVALLEQTYRDMERAYELRWGGPPSTLDTTTWLLMGALNLAHRVVRLEQEASQQTQNLELTLTRLLDDVPDASPDTNETI
ncbi:cell division protein ZapA [Holophaga foetida]|uniref:cell division protein ZapA n=1 Tax=Holophaga foetida TaxID=35839 RepID=UPI0002FD4F00|nr:cell division protein ZapA [Holophaga foetida]